MGKHTIDPQTARNTLRARSASQQVSNADNSLSDYTKFDAFHEYLKETYPLVHKHLTLEHTGQAGLLYHWKGTGKSGAAPLLLMAHQDVVPEGDLEKWTYPPYSGTIADGKIWGRGSSDCKSNLIGQLEAVEALLEKGYEPDYDLYLSYGYMEEVAGGKIPAETLRGTGIRFGAVLDEGGGVRPGSDYGIDDKGLCTIGLCEKGYVDFELSYTAKADTPAAGREFRDDHDCKGTDRDPGESDAISRDGYDPTPLRGPCAVYGEGKSGAGKAA